MIDTKRIYMNTVKSNAALEQLAQECEAELAEFFAEIDQTAYKNTEK
jgi:hypothetical protein